MREHEERENKQSRETCGTQSKSNIRIIRVPKEEEQENEAKAIFDEMMMEGFLTLIKEPLE